MKKVQIAQTEVTKCRVESEQVTGQESGHAVLPSRVNALSLICNFWYRI